MTPARPSVVRATGLVLLSACCFGSVIILTVLARREGASLLSVLTWRYLIGSAVLLAVAGPARFARLPRGRAARLLVLGGGGQASLAFLTLSALDYLPAATVSFLFYTYPAWVALIAAARGTERLDATRVTALALSLAGIVLMVGSPWSGALDAVGVLLALSAALIYAAFIPLLDALQSGVAPALASAYVVGGAGVLFAAGGAAGHTLSAQLSAGAWGAVGALAIFCTALSFILFLRGLAVLGPVRTAIVSTVEPFWTALLAAPVLGQPLGVTTLAGGGMIAAAVLLLQRRAPAGAG